MNTNNMAKLVKLAVGFGLTTLCLMCAAAQPFFSVPPTNPAPVVQLAWTASASPNITNYTAYFGVGPLQYTNRISLGVVLSTTLTLPARGVTYYFAVTAKDNKGLESVYSNEVNFTPSVVPTPPSMQPLVVVVAQQAPTVNGPFVDAGMSWSADPNKPETVYRLAIARGMQLAVVPPPMPR